MVSPTFLHKPGIYWGPTSGNISGPVRVPAPVLKTACRHNILIGDRSSMMGVKTRLKKETAGNSIIEFSLLLPWFLLLFTGVFDFGFYAYALIAVENAARVAVLHSAANTATAADQSGACALAAQELTGLPNVGPTYTGTCSADPITVTSIYCDASTPCSGSSGSADGSSAAYVTVTYRMPPLFRIPIPGVQSITRTAEMRLRDTQP
jgi:hypothetical protein